MTHNKPKAHGVPNWTDCATTDLAAAEDFYRGLFGWKSERVTAADGSVYALQRLDGKMVCGLYELSDETRARHVPPHWSTYFEVDDVDALAKQVETVGGASVESIRTEPGVGRMAIIRDPVGAYLRLWTSAPDHGGEIFNVPGAMTWNELMTSEPEKAAHFYETVLGLQSEHMPAGDVVYTILKAGDQPVAGILPKAAAIDEAPATSWDVYFASNDVDETARRTQSAGGKVLAAPFDVPDGSARMTVLQDPQGAVFEVIKMAEQSS